MRRQLTLATTIVILGGVYNSDTLQNYWNEESIDFLTRSSGLGQPEDASNAVAFQGEAEAIP